MQTRLAIEPAGVICCAILEITLLFDQRHGLPADEPETGNRAINIVPFGVIAVGQIEIAVKTGIHKVVLCSGVPEPEKYHSTF